MTKEEMELEKLKLELNELKRPWYIKPQNLFSLFGLFLAIGGVLIQNEITDFKIKSSEQTIAVGTEFLQDKANQIRESKGISTKSETAFITDVWAYNVSKSIVDDARDYLSSKDYEVGFGGLLNYRPSWLALRSTVFYYDKKSETDARTIAKELEAKLKLKFRVQHGAGLGVIESEKARTFFIHIVQ